jgi:hypothetical protein
VRSVAGASQRYILDVALVTTRWVQNIVKKYVGWFIANPHEAALLSSGCGRYQQIAERLELAA